jgi:hypothetical protein
MQVRIDKKNAQKIKRIIRRTKRSAVKEVNIAVEKYKVRFTDNGK